MLKKISALFLSLGIFFSASVCLAEASDARLTLLNSLGILQGYEDGTYRLENNLTRAEFTKVAIAASEHRKAVSSALATSPYADVPHTLWSAPYIRLAAEKGYVNGYLDSTFRPNDSITLAESTAVFLRLLGYTNSDFGASWPSGHMAIAKDIGLTDGIACGHNVPITRRDTVTLLYNLLDSDLKGTQTEYISVLNCTSQENVIIRATNQEDASIAADKVLTSGGTFRKGPSFSSEWLGYTGELFIENGDTIKAFVPKEQTKKSFSVTDVIGTDLVLNGKIYNWDDALPVYYKSAATTYGQAAANASDGNTLSVFYDKTGTAEYALLLKKPLKENVAVKHENFVVFSILDDSVISYKDGKLEKLTVKDGLPLYEDDALVGTFSKSQLKIGDILEVIYDENNEADYVLRNTKSLQGPVIVTDDTWKKTFSVNDKTAYLRDGSIVKADAIKQYDVLYYSASLNAVLAYTDKITGVYKTATVSADSTATITVSGTPYTIEGVEAFRKINEKKLFSSGDNVTLLLGRTGAAVDILSTDALDESYVNNFIVYSVLNDSIITYQSGTKEKITVEDGLSLYEDDTLAGTFSKSQLKMGDGLRIVYNEDGDAEYVVLDADSYQGPMTVTSENWKDALSVKADTRFICNGVPVEASSVQLHDILYYSEALNTVLVYTDKVSAIYKSASVSNMAGSSVTVSAASSSATYSVEGMSALQKISTKKQFSLGDNVTLLLGRNGKVADILFTKDIANKTDNFIVYSTLKDSIITYKNGVMEKNKLDNGLTVYKENASVLGTLSSVQLKMGDIVKVVYDEDGEAEYIVLNTDGYQGPVTVTNENWKDTLSVNADTAFIRNGIPAAASSIQSYDVLYYSKPLNTVLIYTDKVSAIYKNASVSNISNPTVTVSAASSSATYPVEGMSALQKIGAEKQFSLGDNITLLLGRNGEVADILFTKDMDDRIDGFIVYGTLKNGIITYKNGVMEKIDLDSGLTVYKENASVLGTISSAQLEMGDILTVVYDEEGKASYAQLNTDGLTGPVTVQNSGWKFLLPVNSSTSYLRNGEPVMASGIEIYDVLYYSEALNMVLAYTDKITGVYKSASPSKDAPSSVTVADKTYTIESVEAFRKLGSSGTFSYGDTVTLLLGREGEVADVVTADTSGTYAGFVTQTGTKSYETNNGELYNGYFVTIIQSDGQTITFETDKEYDTLLNHVVILTFSGGKASLKTADAPGISGMLDASSMRLGTQTLSPDVQILDTYAPNEYKSGTAASVFLQRLDGVSLSASKILYIARDSRNRISELILKDATGDLHSYGIVTNAKRQSAGMSVSGSYSYIIGSGTGSYSTNGSAFSIGSNTPAQFSYTGGQIYAITPLTKVSGIVTSVSATTLSYQDGSRYAIGDAAIYSKNSDNTYMLLKKADISPTTHTITAYYDRSLSAGGKIRVIIAEEK